MITSVFRDIVEFAIIGFIIILGFGFVLFAIDSFIQQYEPGWGISSYSLETQDTKANARVFEYLFYAILGEFQTEVGCLLLLINMRVFLTGIQRRTRWLGWYRW